MNIINSFKSRKHCSEEQWSNILVIIYRIAFAYGAIRTAICQFSVFLSVLGALQDVRKFEHTRTFAYFIHFLGTNRFYEAMCACAVSFTELLIFVLIYRQAIKHKPTWSHLWYFAGSSISHVLLWVFLNFFARQTFPEIFFACFSFAILTVSAPIFYFISYVICMIKRYMRQGDGLREPLSPLHGTK